MMCPICLPNKSPSPRFLCFLLMGLTLSSLVTGCGGNDSPTNPIPGVPGSISGAIEYSRNRNQAGTIVPILREGAGGFDSIEVDSPAIAVDGGRPAGDKFLLYYEADGPGGTTIGLITSSEEDLVPVTLNRTQVVGLGPDSGPYSFGATDPTVIVDKRGGQESSRYKIWFEGRSGSSGQTSTIMYGTSADRVTWSSFAPCQGLQVNITQVRIADPCVTLDGNTYKMWFEAVSNTSGGQDGAQSIGYAESADGINWTVKGPDGSQGTTAQPVLSPAGGAQFDSYGVGSPSVVHDLQDAAAPWKLWYEAGNAAVDVQNTIGYATSMNGISWSRSSFPVLNPSSDSHVPLPFDSGDLEHPCAIVDSSIPLNLEGHFLLWYSGDSEGSLTPNRIGIVKGWTP